MWRRDAKEDLGDSKWQALIDAWLARLVEKLKREGDEEEDAGLAHGEWAMRTRRDWHRAASRMRGAGGVDGWCGREVSVLPELLVDVLRGARQVSIRKSNKLCTIENLRPISVFSIWRLHRAVHWARS